MARGTARATLTKSLDQVLATCASVNDENLALLVFEPVACNAYTCGRPNAATHRISASVLEAALTSALGCQPVM